MEVDQSASVSSSLSSDLDDEDKNSSTKNTIEIMEQDIVNYDELKSQIDTPLHTIKESASCDDFEDGDDENLNNCYELRDDFQTEKPPLQDSSQVTSTSSVYKENQKEDISHEDSAIKNCVERSPDTTLKSGESIEKSISVLESCTKNHLISNVDSYNVNNVTNNSTSNVDTYLVPCDQSSSSSSVNDNPMYSSENKNNEGCINTQPACRTICRSDKNEEVSSERTNNCPNSVDFNNLNQGNFEEPSNCASDITSAVDIDNLNISQTEEIKNCASKDNFNINSANTEKTSDIIRSNEPFDTMDVSNFKEEGNIEADESPRTVEMDQEFSSLKNSTVGLANSRKELSVIKNDESVSEENEDLKENSSSHTNESFAIESEDINLINQGKAEENSNIKENQRLGENSVDKKQGFSVSEDRNHSNDSFADTEENTNLKSIVDSEDIGGGFEENFRHREENVERNQELSNLKDYSNNFSKNVTITKENIQSKSDSTKELNLEKIGYSDCSPRPIDNYDHYSISVDSGKTLNVEKMDCEQINSVVENLTIASNSQSLEADSQLKEICLQNSSKTYLSSIDDGEKENALSVKNIQSTEFNNSDSKNLRFSENLEEKNSLSDTLNNEQTLDISEEAHEPGLLNSLYRTEDSDKLDAPAINHTSDIKSKNANPSSSVEKNNMDDHPKLNLNFVPYEKSRSGSPLDSDTEELTNDTKGEKYKCDKLVDYAEDDSDSDDLDCEEGGGSLRIVDDKEHLLRDIDRTDSTSVQVKIDHSKEIEKSSINTYSERNFVDFVPNLTANPDIMHKKLGLSLNTINIESKMLESSLSSSNSEVLVRNERPSLTDFDSSSSDEEELSRSIEKVLLDNENSQTSDSIEQNLNQQRIQLENHEESSVRQVNEDNNELLDSLKRCESVHISSVVNSNNLKNTSLENDKSTDLERIKESSVEVDENVELKTKYMDVESTEKNSVKSPLENKQQKIFSPKDNKPADFEKLENNSEVKILDQKLSSPTKNESTDDAKFEEDLLKNPLAEARSVCPKGSDCTDMEGVEENSVENSAEKVAINKELSMSAKFSNSHNSFQSLDIIKSIEEIIMQSKTEENNRPKAEFVTKINNIIKDKCDSILNTSETISDIVKRIQNIIRENELSDENASHDPHDEEILERIEKIIVETSEIIVETSEDNEGICIIKHNYEDNQVNNITSKDKEGSLTNLNHFADLEMGVFEESDEDSADENIVKETPKIVPAHLSEENSTDTADSDGEDEELSIQQSKQLSSKSLKRKESMNSVSNKQVPPIKKPKLSFQKYLDAKNKYIQCKQCPAVFKFKNVAQHYRTCKGSLSNGFDISDGESLLYHSVADQVSKSTQSFATLASKPKSGTSKSNTNFLTRNNAPSSMDLAKKSHSSTDLFTKNNLLSPNISPINNLHTKNIAIPPFSQHIPILPKPNNFFELNKDSSVSKSPEPNKTVPRQVFLCAACQLYFEYWNLYLHMLEKHKRFICMYCLGMFGQSENLYTHLQKRHKIACTYIPNNNTAVYKEYTNNKFILTCTTCGLVLDDNDMDRHVCGSDLPSGSTLNKFLNSSLTQNSVIGSYPDPESFMLATMTEGEDKRPQTVEIITLDEASTVTAPEQENSTQLASPTTLPSVTSIMKAATGLSSLDKLTNTINEVAENRTEQKVSTSENNVLTYDSMLKPLSPKATTPTKPSVPSVQDRASAALSELEKCHKMLIEERTSDEETESDIDDSPMKLSTPNCVSKTPEKSFLKDIDLAKPTNRDSTSEISTSTDDDSDVKNKDEILKRTKDGFFDAKVVLTKIDGSIDSFQSSDDQSRTSTVPPSRDNDKINENTSQHTSNQSQLEAESSNESSFKEDTSQPNISPEKNFSSQENEDDDDNRDLNDSDNENSLKIDDSVFEDDEEIDENLPTEITPEVSNLKPPEESHEDVEKKMSSLPAFKINPLRIKIKCGTNSGDNQYERVKTETEIREKEARERRYDEAIDEVIRKSIAEYDMKEAEREKKEKEKESREMEKEQKEKDEYERLQAELAKKQEEYHRIQEAYLSLQMRSDSQDDHQADDGEENESTELDESLEEMGESQTENTEIEKELQERDDKADVDIESVEKDNEERVKLIERRFQDEKSSLLKEELLKKCEKLFAGVDQLPEEEPEPSEEASVPLASEDIQPMALSLEEPLENTDIKIVIKECLRTSCSVCVHCYHATRIVANGRQLALHILAEHRYTPVKNDTSEDLIRFISSNLNKLDETFFSSDTFDPADKSCFAPFDSIYYCLQCSFASKHQRELTSHKRKMHPKTSQICLMCKQILLNQSELLFHYCAGVSNTNPADNIYWCGICGLDKIPSAFRLMVHLRKKHNTCNVCLESCANEGKLLQHMLKHKIIHMCYKCNISYRNKQDITKHLFWKHGTESIVCKRCLQKRWSHVYHFCQPPARFTCDECNLTFKSSSTLKVHKRIHAGVFPYECKEEACEEKFVSKKLLEKHIEWHRAPPKAPTPPLDTDPTTGEPHIDVCNVDDSASLLATLKPGGKSKKKKKSKFDLNNMNLPPLNLSSESDSSDDEAPSEAASTIADGEDDKAKMLADADAASQDQSVKPDAIPVGGELTDKPTLSETPLEEATEKPTEAPTNTDLSGEALPSVDMPDITPAQPTPPPSEPAATDSVPPEEDPPVAPTEIVPDVWDQFKSFTASLNVFRHVEEEHDYHVVYEREPSPPPPEQKTEESAQSVEPPAPSQVFPIDATVETKESEVGGEVVKGGEKSANSTLNKSTSGDDSSSDSSSSSSCGSQCGSNCSCSSSSSSSSSSSDDSSSDSDSSDPDNRKRQEEKRQAKKLRKRAKKHSHANEQNVTIENQPEEGPASQAMEGVTHAHETPAPEQPALLPPIAESDLETDVSSSDEDFYDEKPQASAPPAPPPTPVSSSPHVAQSPLPYASPQSYYPPPPASHTPRTPSRKRKRPRMRNVPSSSSTPKHASTFKTSFKHPFMRPSPAFEKKPPGGLLAARDTPPGRSSSDDNTRSSKRKRKQNRFYGYSDDEEPGEYDNDESEEYAVRPPPFKKKLWRHPSADDRIPLPPASPPPYESKIRFENPLRLKIATDFSRNPQIIEPAYDMPYQSDTTPEYSTPEPAAAHSPSSSDEDPTMAQYNALAAMPPPPIVPEAGAVPLYCYCRCPYDEVSEMIACDGDDCEIEWYHFECVNILVPPKGKWYCPQCRPKYQPFGS